MPETKRPLKVFLCHAHTDREPVRALYNRLVGDGVDAWLDKEKLLPGQDWKLEIENAVRESDVVIVCLSKLFNLEGFRQREVRWALDKAMDKPERDIFIIPARLEECESLESLSKWHEVNLFEDGGYEFLVRALRARAEKVGVTLQKIRNPPIRKQLVPKIAIDKFIVSLRNFMQGSLPFFRVMGIIVVIGVIIWGGSLALPKITPLIPTLKATLTERFFPQSTFTNAPVVVTQINNPTSIPARRTPTKTAVKNFTPTFASLSNITATNNCGENLYVFKTGDNLNNDVIGDAYIPPEATFNLTGSVSEGYIGLTQYLTWGFFLESTGPLHSPTYSGLGWVFVRKDNYQCIKFTQGTNTISLNRETLQFEIATPVP